jgi:hypothetical protein
VKIKIGDYVRVRKGIKEIDFGSFVIGGFQGTVFSVEEYPDETIVGIKWDEETLSKMPRKMLNRCLKDIFEHDKMYLSLDEVEIIPQGS